MSKKLYIITNTFPSEKNKIKGVFVKKMYENLHLDKKIVLIHNNYRTNIFFRYILFYLRIFLALLDKNGVYYVHQVTHSGLLFILFPRAKVIFNFHGYDLLPPDMKGNVMLKLLIPRVSIASGIVVPSEFFRAILVNRINLEEGKIFISPSGGVDVQKMDCLERSFKFGMISRFEDKKGWEDYFRLIVEYNRRYPGHKYFAGGYGNQFFLDKYIHQDLDLTIDTNLIHKEALTRMCEIEHFVFPSLHQESLGLVALEARFLSCKLITSCNGALPDVTNKYGGLSVSFNDINIVITEILSDRVDWFKGNCNDFTSEKVGIDLSEFINNVLFQDL